MRVGWIGQPHLLNTLTGQQWFQSVAVEVPTAAIWGLQQAPIVVAIGGVAVQSTSSCRAKLPKEIPSDLVWLRR